jgi:hypothetical protein
VRATLTLRGIFAALVTAVILVFMVLAATHPARAATIAKAAPATCTHITNVGAGSEITGGGVNAPVTVTGSGNCFSAVFSGSSSEGNWNEWQNGAGHCLFNNGGTLDVGAACAGSGHPNEEMLSPGLSGGGNAFAAVSLVPNFWSTEPHGCTEGSEVGNVNNLNGNCGTWLFSS